MRYVNFIFSLLKQQRCEGILFSPSPVQGLKSTPQGLSQHFVGKNPVYIIVYSVYKWAYFTNGPLFN